MTSKRQKRDDNDETNSLSSEEVDAVARLIFSGYVCLTKKEGSDRYNTITLTGPMWMSVRASHKAIFPRDPNKAGNKELSGEISAWLPGWEYLEGQRPKKGGQLVHDAPGVTHRPGGFEPLTQLRNGEYYLNPRLSSVADGKKRLYVSRLMLLALGVPLQQDQAPAYHVLVHAIVWRWCAGMPVPGGIQVSHVGDAILVVTPTRLVGEPGPFNRSRTVCGQGFLAGKIPDSLCMRCQKAIRKCCHWPNCTYPAVIHLPADAFAYPAGAPGLPGKVRNLWWVISFDGLRWEPAFPPCYQCQSDQAAEGGQPPSNPGV